MRRPGIGVRPVSRRFETSLLTHWLVTSTGLRDTDNLWFDGVRGCQVSDKVLIYVFRSVLEDNHTHMDALRRNGLTTKALSHPV